MRQQRDLHVIETPPGKYGCFNRPAQVECRYHHDDPLNRLDPKCMGCDHQMRPWREMGRRKEMWYNNNAAGKGVQTLPATYHRPDSVSIEASDRNGL